MTLKQRAAAVGGKYVTDGEYHLTQAPGGANPWTSHLHVQDVDTTIGYWESRHWGQKAALPKTAEQWAYTVLHNPPSTAAVIGTVRAVRNEAARVVRGLKCGWGCDATFERAAKAIEELP